MPRPLSEFIMWNHVFIAHASYRCIRRGYVALGSLGSLAAVLSLLYHSHRERAYAVPEGVVAKSCVFLLMYHGMEAGLSARKVVIPNMAVFVLWRLSQRHYEWSHPWMHLVVSANVHYFLHCVKRGAEVH